MVTRGKRGDEFELFMPCRRGLPAKPIACGLGPIGYRTPQSWEFS